MQKRKIKTGGVEVIKQIKKNSKDMHHSKGVYWGCPFKMLDDILKRAISLLDTHRLVLIAGIDEERLMNLDLASFFDDFKLAKRIIILPYPKLSLLLGFYL